MTIRYAAICAGAVLAAIAMQGTSAQALTMTECSAKYKAAKDAGSLNGMKWNDFRKAQCGSDAQPPLRQQRRRRHGICTARRRHPSPRRPRPRPALPSSRSAIDSKYSKELRRARPAWKPASISTRPTRPAMATAA